MDKADILREIKRTASVNGGAPLGWRRFETETGIKLSDWSKFWARWADAIREAGLTPNEFAVGYDNSVLLDHFAQLAREIGRIPAWSDLKLKAYNDPTFPSEKAFRRFKSKGELVKQLAQRCQCKDGWNDVVSLCEGYSPRPRRSESPGGDDDETERGYVYLIRMGRYYKVGKTNNVGRREYELNLQLPERAELVHTISTDDPTGIEDYWHRRFAAKRTNGEWFRLSASDVAAFKRRKFM